MPTYIVLADFTEQGIEHVKGTVHRVDALRDQLSSLGVDFKDAWWTLGEHDVINIFEAPNDETMTAASLTIAEQGNVRFTTMRAFSEEEMRGVLERVS